MASIVYKSLSSLSPVELKYEYYRNEKLQAAYKNYKEGYTFYEVDGLADYQDIAINKGACLVLTNSVNLSTVFTQDDVLFVGTLPASIYIQPRNSFIYYAKYDSDTNTIRQALSSETPSVFYISPVDSSGEVEIFIENKYLQVKEQYPYVVYTAERSLDSEEINRQRFKVK
jgi:hypothetical protein